MIEIQKIIKYLAVVFAIFLIFSIFSGIMMGINGLSHIFNDEEITLEDLNNIDIKEEIRKLNINLTATNLIIKYGDKLKVESNNESLKYNYNKNTLLIEDNTKWYKSSKNHNLVIYLPTTLEEILIENGAGKVEIEELKTNKLYLDLGAGKVEINNLTVTNSAEINGGAGEIIIDNATINNLDLDMGVGELNLTSVLNGDSEIDAGIGTINLNLIGREEDYKIHLDKGIGNAKINGIKMEDDKYYGTGSNEIEINGGIGNINITISE